MIIDIRVLLGFVSLDGYTYDFQTVSLNPKGKWGHPIFHYAMRAIVKFAMATGRLDPT
jgi:hypothetical protein